VLSIARCGDRIVAIGYAFAALSYFAGRGMPGCLRSTRSPSTCGSTPHTSTSAVISHPAGAREEAQQLVATVPFGERLWVFGSYDGYSSEAAGLLDHGVCRSNRPSTGRDGVQLCATVRTAGG